MTILRPDATTTLNGVKINEYLLTKHNPNHIDGCPCVLFRRGRAACYCDPVCVVNSHTNDFPRHGNRGHINVVGIPYPPAIKKAIDVLQTKIGRTEETTDKEDK